MNDLVFLRALKLIESFLTNEKALMISVDSRAPSYQTPTDGYAHGIKAISQVSLSIHLDYVKIVNNDTMLQMRWLSWARALLARSQGWD